MIALPSSRNTPRGIARRRDGHVPARGFLKLMRSPATEALFTDPVAFVLLIMIAWRAWRSLEPNLHGLGFGQALIGDYQEIGISRQQYRSACGRLAKWGLATFSTSNRGTIATLTDSRVFSLRDEREPAKSNRPVNQQDNQQFPGGDLRIPASEATVVPTSSQPAANQQPTTNKNGRTGELKIKTVGKAVASPSVSDEQWLTGLANDPAFKGLDVAREHAKMARWCSEHGKQPTRRRFIGWLNRCDRPINGPTSPSRQLDQRFVEVWEKGGSL